MSAPRSGPTRYADADALLAGPEPLIVALDQVQDPQNLGAICRSAECAGAAGVVLPERRAAEVTPAVCKASAGAVEHLPVAQVRNLDRLPDGRQVSWTVVLRRRRGRAIRYDAVDYAGGVVLVLGSEGRGLRPRVGGELRRARLDPAERPDRVAERQRRRRRAALRSPWRAGAYRSGLDTRALLCQAAAGSKDQPEL